ncbi:helix-turn-helix domain-containing protein [Runella sp. CRIBMP]|uniref:AraC family transcriptional regulator n=1 Tax=Runella sp. CRIBMP TaxID=2683261 RepID=UPI001411C72F|nr:AraC family transcriptional regulator [Runella sp. CRIBMP]NBB19592.1 helix-turn-helix domain-containing protein [Runella sp. CRIBMP]
MKLFRKYFTLDPGTNEQNQGINILNVGHNIHPANHPYPDIQHPNDYYFEWDKGRSLKEYQIIYISKGEGYFEANGLPPQVIEEGTIILLYPGVWHRYRPKEKTGWEEYWVGFSGTYAHYLLEQECFNPQNPIIKVGFNAEFLETFSKLIEVIEARGDSFQKLSSFQLIHLLGIVYASVLLSNQKISRKEEIIDKIRDEIHRNWNKDIDFEALARKFNLSYIWFRKTFKEVLGTSPNQYHLTLKLRKAEQLIQESNLTLAEIAYQSGFESEFYFSRIFKKKMNYNASELRKKK